MFKILAGVRLRKRNRMTEYLEDLFGIYGGVYPTLSPNRWEVHLDSTVYSPQTIGDMLDRLDKVIDSGKSIISDYDTRTVGNKVIVEINLEKGV